MVIDFNERPDGKFIDETLTYLRDRVWNRSHAAWEKLDGIYQRRYPVWPSAGEAAGRESYRPSTPTNIIDHAADAQMAFEPRIHRDPVGSTAKHKEDADSVEEALSAVFADAAMKETVIPWKAAEKYMLHCAYAVLEGPLLDFSRRPKEPVRTDFSDDDEYEEALFQYQAAIRNWSPIRIRAPHPARVLMDPEEKEPLFAIKLERMPVYKLVMLSERKAKTRKLAQRYDPEGKRPYEMVDVVRYWTSRWHTLKVMGGDMLYTERNSWGYVPFTHGFAGFGMEPVRLQDVDPSYIARGMLEPIEDSIKLQAQSSSAKHTLLIRTAYAKMRTSLDPHETARQMGSDIMQGDEGDFGLIPTPQVAGWMFEAGREYAEDIEAGSFVRAIAGIRQEGVTTVGQQAILTTAAEKKFVAPNYQVEEMASIIASRTLRLVDTVKVLGGAIGARGKTLRKSQIHGNYNVRVRFQSVDPILDLQRRQQGAAEVTQGLRSVETFLEEDARVANTQKEMDRIQDDILRQMPELSEVLARAAAQRLGYEDEVEEAIRLRKEREAGVRGQGSRARGNATTGLEPSALSGTQRAGDVVRNGLTPSVPSRPRTPGVEALGQE